MSSPTDISGRYHRISLPDISTLTPTARVILGLVASGPRTGYDIKRISDVSTRFFWGASYGQIYPELRRLEQGGLVEVSDEPRGRVRRRVYRITPGGQAALREWLLDPDTTYEIRDEGLLRLFFSDLLAPEEVVDLVRRRRTWFELTAAYFREIGGELDARDDDVLRYGIELMEWNAAWFARLEERLTQD
jgi:DNA-binding PadR family transcriptional regulator